MTNTKIENAITYILNHPVQFGAKYSDRCILSNNDEFMAEFDTYLSHQHIKINKIPMRKFTRILWEFYTVWINKPETHAAAYISKYRLENILDGVLVNAVDYMEQHPETFKSDRNIQENIRTDGHFRQIVRNVISVTPEQYDNMPQENAAMFIWALYKHWVLN